MPSIEEFGRKLKEKYPQYGSIDDRELGLKMLEKHPEYKDRVFDTDPDTQAKIAGVNTETRGVFDAVKKGFSNIKEGIQKSGEELSNTLESGAPEPLKVMKTATGLIKGIISPIAEAAIATPARIVGEVAQNVTGIDVNEAVAQGTQKLVQKGLDTEQAKKAMEGWAQLKETNPEAAMALSTVLDIADIASNAIGIKGAKMAGEAGLKGAVKTAEVTGKAVGKVADTAGEATKYAVGQTFGLNKETVKNIIDNPGLFTQKEIAKIDRESIFTKAKNALESRMEALSETGKEYNNIRQIPVKTSVSEKTILDKLAEKGIDVTDGKISVNLGSEIQLSKADIAGLEEVLGLLKGKDGLTPTEILNLRKRLSNLSGFSEGRTDASSKVAKEIRATIDQIAKNEIPGLAEIDAKFSSERQFLDKVKGVMFDKKGNIKDNAISKIATLTGKGKEFMLERMERIIPGITEDLNILKAIEDIDYAKGQKVGSYGRAMIGAGGGAVVGGPVGAILGAIATSPQVGVSLIRSYGKAKGMAKEAIEAVIGKMKSGKNLLDTEKKIIDEAVNEAAKKAGSRLKDFGGKAGLSIEDVKIGRAGYSDDLLQEARKYESEEEFVKAQFDRKPEYGMSHRPSWEGMPPAYNLLEGETLPRDVYTHPDFSIASGSIRRGDKAANESWNVLQKIKDNPEAEVTLYRAGAKNELNTGDWVTFSKDYAKQSLEGAEKVHSFKAKAKDVIFAGDDINEFGYYPKSKLTDIWNKSKEYSSKKYIQDGSGKMKGSVTGMNENIGKVKDGAKKIKERILNEMADFTEYAAKQKNGEKIEYVLDEIRARKIAEQLGINPDVSNWELSKKFGKILEKYNYIR